MTGDLIQAVKNSLKPLVSDNMSDDMLDAWLTDLAQAAIAAIQADADLEQIKRERDQAVEALREAERAIGDHIAPNDCYTTGPLTGDDYRDLVECPACSFIAMYDKALGGQHD